MQAFFDKHDAELEYESLVSRSRSKAEPLVGSNSHLSARRYVIELIALALVFCVAIFILTDHLVLANPVLKIKEPDPEIKTSYFVIEIPPQILVEPKYEPEYRELESKSEPKEPLRSVPDMRVDHKRMAVDMKNRVSHEQQHDRSVSDQAAERAMPAVTTPVIERSLETAERSVGEEMLAYTSMGAYADTIGAFASRSGSDDDVRLAPDENLSRIKLDPYHYQIVNVCMRLCMKSIFTRSGMSEQQANRSSTWLRVDRSDNARFEYLNNGRWLEFIVFVDEITDISNINFVDIPSRDRSNTEINELLENVTAHLCSLLEYSDCLDQLKH